MLPMDWAGDDIPLSVKRVGRADWPVGHSGNARGAHLKIIYLGASDLPYGAPRDNQKRNPESP